MPNNIHIRSTDCESDLVMYAKPEVIHENRGDTVKFHNHVKSDHPIKIEFYKLKDKGEPGEEIQGFCDEMGSTDTVLTIEKNKNAECTVPTSMFTKYYAYTVKNDDADTLDPVIIIDDAFDFFGALPLIAVGGAAFGAFGGYKYFKYKFMRKAAS